MIITVIYTGVDSRDEYCPTVQKCDKDGRMNYVRPFWRNEG